MLIEILGNFLMRPINECKDFLVKLLIIVVIIMLGMSVYDIRENKSIVIFHVRGWSDKYLASNIL